MMTKQQSFGAMVLPSETLLSPGSSPASVSVPAPAVPPMALPAAQQRAPPRQSLRTDAARPSLPGVPSPRLGAQPTKQQSMDALGAEVASDVTDISSAEVSEQVEQAPAALRRRVSAPGFSAVAALERAQEQAAEGEAAFRQLLSAAQEEIASLRSTCHAFQSALDATERAASEAASRASVAETAHRSVVAQAQADLDSQRRINSALAEENSDVRRMLSRAQGDLQEALREQARAMRGRASMGYDVRGGVFDHLFCCFLLVLTFVSMIGIIGKGPAGTKHPSIPPFPSSLF
jgi:hypothetical protein